MAFPSTSSLPIKEQTEPAESRFQQSSLLNAVEDMHGGVKVDVEEPMDSNVYASGLLNAVEDMHGGVKVDVEEPMDSNVYVPLLRASISQWRQQGKKGVSIKLPIQLANLVEPTVEEGFRYHHAEPDYLMSVCWIPETPDTLPANASHTVGIGAFVVNDNRKVPSPYEPFSSGQPPVSKEHYRHKTEVRMLIDNKRLTSTDIQHRLAYPIKNLDAFPISIGQNPIGFEVRDAVGKVWNFELSVRAQGHPKPVIIGGWLLYVREKGLVVGDRIFLTREKDGQNGVTYRIRVEPKTDLTL